MRNPSLIDFGSNARTFERNNRLPVIFSVGPLTDESDQQSVAIRNGAVDRQQGRGRGIGGEVILAQPHSTGQLRRTAIVHSK